MRERGDERMKDLIEITIKEYNLLKAYKKDAQEIMKFLAINHHNIYMNICYSKLRKIEDRVFTIKNKKIKDEIQ